MRFQPEPMHTIALTAFLAGGFTVLAADEFSLPRVEALGMVVLAVAPAVIGVRAMLSGRIRLPQADEAGGDSGWEELYRGIGARSLGLLLLLVGAALALYGLVRLGGLEAGVEGLLERSPGLAAAALGVGLLLHGTSEAGRVAVIDGSGQERRIWRLPERTGGAATALLGLALLVGGLLHTASPALFRRAAGALGRALLSWLLG